MKMENIIFIELAKKIKETLNGISEDMSNFTLSLTNHSEIDPEEYVREVNRDVNSVKGFEVFYIHESVAFPGQYDVYIRRERKPVEELQHA